MRQQLIDWINNFDFGTLWQWLSSLPLLPKVLSIVGPIAAVVGLVVNLPKAYSRLRRTVARLEIQKFSMSKRDPSLVDFQLDLCVHATHGNVNFKGVYLKNKTRFHLQYNEAICLYNEPDSSSPSNQAEIKLAIPKTSFEFTRFTENEFRQLIQNQLGENQVDIRGFQVPENSLECLTLVGRLKGKIIDGANFSDIPLEDWSIRLEYYDERKVEVPLKPEIIDG